MSVLGQIPLLNDFGPVETLSLRLPSLIIIVAHAPSPKDCIVLKKTRRPASADRIARRQFQATGQPVSRTQASDATQVLSIGVSPFAFRYQGKGATPCQYIDTTRKAIDCATTVPQTVLYNETLQQTFRLVLSKLSKRRQI